MIIGAVLVVGYGGSKFIQSSSTTTMAAREDAIIVAADKHKANKHKQCSAKYKDCKESKCCKDAGLQCFQKNKKMGHMYVPM
jgi:hypothetical protein